MKEHVTIQIISDDKFFESKEIQEQMEKLKNQQRKEKYGHKKKN